MMGLLGSGAGGGVISGGGGGFTPGGLGANLIAWYQAAVSGSNTTVINTGSTPATDTQTVVQWKDSTSNNQHIGASANKPVWNSTAFNGGPCVTFSAAGPTWLVGPSAPPSGLTAFSVFLYGNFTNSTASYGRIFTTQVAGSADAATPTQNYIPIIRQGSGSFVEAYQGGDVAAKAMTYASTSHHVIGSCWSGSSIATFVDGASASAASSFTMGTISWALGAGVDSSLGIDTSSPFDGQIVEVIIANIDLSSQAAAIGTYFTTRWGS